MNEVINGDSLIAVVGQFRRELVEVLHMPTLHIELFKIILVPFLILFILRRWGTGRHVHPPFFTNPYAAAEPKYRSFTLAAIISRFFKIINCLKPLCEVYLVYNFQRYV